MQGLGELSRGQSSHGAMASRCGEDRPMISTCKPRKKKLLQKREESRFQRMSRACLPSSLPSPVAAALLCFAFKSLHLAWSAQRGQRLSNRTFRDEWMQMSELPRSRERRFRGGWNPTAAAAAATAIPTKGCVHICVVA